MQTSSSQTSPRVVANWIYIGVLMLVIQVILGGITRLTGSGLSITEWNLGGGSIPPLNQQQWSAEFLKYQQTPQFHLLNPDFTLSNYKFIFFWEWFHRFWARLVGVVFLIGFGWLLWKKKLTGEMIRPLIILFLLGAMQAVIGWIMVKSGLTGDAIYVQPTKLALHFVFALGLICYTLWFAMQLSVPPSAITLNSVLRRWTWAIVLLLFIQVLFGALMAGNKAATAAPTWPSINGNAVPASMFNDTPFVLNFINNKITIHFVHRGLAYLIFILVVGWTWKAFRTNLSTGARNIRWLPLLAVGLQIILGITAVLVSPQIVPGHWGGFEWLALLHQATGLLFLLLMICMLYLIRPTNRQSSI